MKLSELIKLRQDLLSLDISPLETMSKRIIADTKTINFHEYDSSKLMESLGDAQTAYASTRANIADLVSKIDHYIKNLDLECKKLCKHEEQFHIRASVKDNRELRKYTIHAEVRKKVVGRLGQYISWKHPGLEIGPGDGEWTEYLVGMDPLYLVDIHEEFLDATKIKFHHIYQKRLRTYKISHGDLTSLPKEQFGFVFSWNVFNYFSLDTIKLYLEQLKPLLKPGGVVMFSYNNCENYKSAEMFEGHYMTYVPNRELVAIIKDLGYEIITSRDEPTLTSWVEIKLPGELESNRAGQTLGKIHVAKH